MTLLSRSGLTMPLYRRSVETFPETSSHATCQGTFDHSRLISATVDCSWHKEWNHGAWAKLYFRKKNADGEWTVEHSPKILASGEKATTKIPNTQEIKRTLFNHAEQDKTCKFSMYLSFRCTYFRFFDCDFRCTYRWVHRKFARFVLFRLIKKRSFNLLCVWDLFSRTLAVNSVSDFFIFLMWSVLEFLTACVQWLCDC